MAWVTNGLFANPADGTVLADSGPVSQNAVFRVTVTITAQTALGATRLQHRNAANSSNIKEHVIRTPVNETKSLNFGEINLEINERVRVVQDGTITGNIQVSLTAFEP